MAANTRRCVWYVANGFSGLPLQTLTLPETLKSRFACPASRGYEL